VHRPAFPGDLLQDLHWPSSLNTTMDNLLMLDVCARLTDAQLDAKPRSVTKEQSARRCRSFQSQQGYLRFLPDRATVPWEEESPPPIEKRANHLNSAAAVLELTRDEANRFQERRRTRDNWWVEPGAGRAAINHATEHASRSAACSPTSPHASEIDRLGLRRFAKP